MPNVPLHNFTYHLEPRVKLKVLTLFMLQNKSRYMM